MKNNSLYEVIFAHGHKNILASHKTTIEFTKDLELSKKGDCVVAVASSKSLIELNDEFKKRLKKNNSKLAIIIEIEGLTEKIIANGTPKLLLSNTREIVIRKSDYIDDRTLAIKADKAACDLSANLRKKLKDPKKIVKITLWIN